MTALVLCVFLLLGTTGRAQFDFHSAGGRGSAMGGCSAALDDYWSSISNLAGSAWFREISFGLDYTQLYVMQAESQKEISAMFPLGTNGTTLTDYLHYGDAHYNEQKVTAGYALRLSRKIASGVAFHYLYSGTSDPWYEPIKTVSISCGLQYRPSNDWTIGAMVFNPIFVRMNRGSETKVPIVMKIGCSYKGISHLTVAAEMEKNIYLPYSMRLGAEYEVIPHLCTRIGFISDPSVWCFGLGYRASRYNVDIAIQNHYALGLTPHISVTGNL